MITDWLDHKHKSEQEDTDSVCLQSTMFMSYISILQYGKTFAIMHRT